MKFHELKDGTVMAYEDMGEGRPVIFIAGWTCNYRDAWGACMPLVEKGGYRVVATDQRSVKETSPSKTRPVELDMLVDDLREMIGFLGLEDVTLVGSSLGAYQIFRYIEKYGCDGLHSIVIVDQAPRTIKAFDWDLGMLKGEYTAEMGLEMYFELKEDFLGRQKKFARKSDEEMEKLSDEEYEKVLLERLEKIRPEEATELFYTSIHCDFRYVLPHITVPTGYFYATPGSLYKPELKDYYEKMIPGAVTSVPFESNDHAFFEKMPEQFSEELIRFMREH